MIDRDSVWSLIANNDGYTTVIPRRTVHYGLYDGSWRSIMIYDREVQITSMKMIDSSILDTNRDLNINHRDSASGLNHIR